MKISSPSKPTEDDSKEKEVAALPLISAFIAKTSSKEERQKLRAASISDTPDRSPKTRLQKDTPLAKLD